MEHPCYKCGQVVDEGRPFCPHCAAPQIRVVVAQPDAARALAEGPSDAQEAPLPASQTVPVLALPMQWSQALKPCALAALIASLLMSLGLYPFVAMVVVGFLAVIFYGYGRRGDALRPSTAARIGALSGLLWFAVSSILETTIILILHKGPDLRKAMLDILDQTVSRTSDLQAQEMLTRFKTPQGIEILMVLGLVVGFVGVIVLAAFGGVLGGAFLGRRGKG